MLSPHPDGILVTIWVVPGARRDEIVGIHDDALRVRVSAPPEGGRANRAAAALVAGHFGVRRGRVVSGSRARRKQVLVEGIELGAARLLLAGDDPEG